MSRIVSTLFSLAFAVLMVGGAAAPATANGVHYRAELAAPGAGPPQRVVAHRIVWKCGPAGCVAARGNSRPAVECAALARKVGPIASFSAAGRALDAAALEKCNARAR